MILRIFMATERMKYITDPDLTGTIEIIPAVMLISVPIKRFQEISLHQTWV